MAIFNTYCSGSIPGKYSVWPLPGMATEPAMQRAMNVPGHTTQPLPDDPAYHHQGGYCQWHDHDNPPDSIVTVFEARRAKLAHRREEAYNHSSCTLGRHSKGRNECPGFDRDPRASQARAESQSRASKSTPRAPQSSSSSSQSDMHVTVSGPTNRAHIFIQSNQGPFCKKCGVKAPDFEPCAFYSQ